MAPASYKKVFLSKRQSKFMKRFSKKKANKPSTKKNRKNRSSKKRYLKKRISRRRKMRGGSGYTGGVLTEAAQLTSKITGGDFSDNITMKHDAANEYGNGNQYVV